MLKGIIAINNLSYLGKDGKMLWKSKEDFKHFKKSTMGDILIVGRKTFENDLKGIGLPGRECIVVGSNYNSPMEALSKAILRRRELISNILIYKLEEKEPNIWVIGGSQIYNIFLPLIDELHVSHINDDQEGDVKFDVSKFKGNIIDYNFEKSE